MSSCMKKHLNQILADNTGQKITKVEKDSDRDNFMPAKDAVAYGLVDKVIA